MKLEILGSILKKEPTELASTLKIAEGSDVPDDQVSKLITAHIESERALLKASIETEQKGMQTRLAKTALEKSLKEKFAFLKGSKLDDMMDEIDAQLSSSGSSDSEKLALTKQIEAFKLKAEKAEKELSDFTKAEADKARKASIVARLSAQLEKYEFVSDKVKELAIDQFINSNSFIVSGTDIFLEKDSKPVVISDKDIESHFSSFGSVKDTKKKLPNTRDEGGEGKLSRQDLFKKLKEASTPEDIARIQEQISSLETEQ